MNTTNTTEQTAQAPAYENNPFYIATKGLEILFKHAQSVGILLAIFAVVSALNTTWNMGGKDNETGQPATASEGPLALPNLSLEAWLVIGGLILIVVTVAIIISIIVKGISDVTAARLARGQAITLTEAFRTVFENLGGYIWVNVVAGVKTLLWTLLFFIPGIVMATRYSLAGVSFFDKGLRGNAAVQHSSQLVKGAWSTTFAAHALFNIITFGLLQPVLYPGTSAVLYGQLLAAGDVKQKPHILSVVTVWLVMTLFALVAFALFVLLPWALANFYQATA